MNISGVIVEYNPFHNGHKYHLSRSKEITQSDYTIAVMSGHFLQRGEPALFNKWIRTKMALKAGVDVVIELPVVFSCQSAELFAFGAVQILEKLGVVNYLTFGSECNNIEYFEKISRILAYEPDLFKQILKQELNKGLPFPSARSKALEQYIGSGEDNCSNIVPIMNEPNNILGIEYVKWLTRFNSSMVPKTIQRIGSNYHDDEISSQFASATAIRKHLFSKVNSFEILKTVMPSSTLSIVEEALDNGFIPAQLDMLSSSILSILFRNNSIDLKNILDISEGLDNRFYNLLKTNSLEEYINLIKTKRYTRTRIQRILCHVLLNLTEQDLHVFMKNDGVQYIRVLGFSEKGKNILSEMKKKCSLPIITNLSKSYYSLNQTQKKMMDFDILATNLYNLHFSKPLSFKGNMDFHYSPIIIK